MFYVQDIYIVIMLQVLCMSFLLQIIRFSVFY